MKLAARISAAVAPRTVLYALIPKVVSVIECDDTGSRALGFSLWLPAMPYHRCGNFRRRCVRCAGLCSMTKLCWVPIGTHLVSFWHVMHSIHWIKMVKSATAIKWWHCRADVFGFGMHH